MKPIRHSITAAALAVAVLSAAQGNAEVITVRDSADGESHFRLKVTDGYISTPEGNAIYFWGYSSLNETAPASPGVQYPGPTLEVIEGDVVTVELTSDLMTKTVPPAPVPVSIVFPGQSGVTTVNEPGGAPNPVGLLSAYDVVSGGKVTYTFTASSPGTYMYHSGTNPDLQIPMGLFGALIVRPAGYNPDDPATWTAYGDRDTAYDREYLFLLSEMDSRFNQAAELGKADTIDTTSYFPVYWMINGRCAPDTLFPPRVEWLPAQPYNAMPRMFPNEKVLMRVIGGGRDLHPFHHHGNHARVIARDGRMLSSSPGRGADLAHKVFTIESAPGQTVDAIFEWTGARVGWDIYGHQPGDPLVPGEYEPDHGKPLPTLLPDGLDVGFGGWWSGSPFLGQEGGLPPGEGGLNPTAAMTFLWHSHTEKELVNNDIFPGGMLSMLFVEGPGTVLTAHDAPAGN